MQYSYNQVTSLTEDDYRNKAISKAVLADENKYTLSDEDDMQKIERLLDVKIGLLTRGDYFFERYLCECGRKLTVYDFIFTAIIDAEHDKSFILHTFTGNKSILNKPRITRCSSCARKSSKPLGYSMEVNSYSCGVTATI